ncbi:MAG TPA: hypothetical protein VFE24_00355 [Pirellulales bacterium]|jgi:hypothetical protein|nr:hypothetical protein [Pirellulales bacterium]
MEAHAARRMPRAALPLVHGRLNKKSRGRADDENHERERQLAYTKAVAKIEKQLKEDKQHSAHHGGKFHAIKGLVIHSSSRAAEGSVTRKSDAVEGVREAIPQWAL